MMLERDGFESLVGAHKFCTCTEATHFHLSARINPQGPIMSAFALEWMIPRSPAVHFVTYFSIWGPHGIVLCRYHDSLHCLGYFVSHEYLSVTYPTLEAYVGYICDLKLHHLVSSHGIWQSSALTNILAWASCIVLWGVCVMLHHAL